MNTDHSEQQAVMMGHRSFGGAGVSVDSRGLNQVLMVIEMFCDDDDDGSM